jgi:hypothetical protein
MAEPQPRREDSPSTAPDLRDAARNTQTGEPLKTAVEVVTSRLAETAEEGRAPAQSVGGDVPVRGGGADHGSRGWHDSPLSRRIPADRARGGGRDGPAGQPSPASGHHGCRGIAPGHAGHDLASSPGQAVLSAAYRGTSGAKRRFRREGERADGGPRHHFVYLRADVSRPYRFIVTPQIRRSELFPGGSLVLARCRVVAGAAGLDSTRSSAFRTEVKVILTGAEPPHGDS